jgi:serine/threonine protein kinase
MSDTQRPIDEQIISSGIPFGTERNDGTIISSSVISNHIISSSLTDDVILNCIQYKIIKLIARSGESEIYLVSNNEINLVFKYYYSQFKPKDEVLEKLKGLKHPDIICLIDHGYYHDRFFEISEYAFGGTIVDIMPVTSLQKVKEIVGETVEALNYCHTHGIIHRDIKPENIFYRTSDKKDIAIGDFGIASNVKEGEEYVLTTLARTNLYAAPELFTNIRGKSTIEKSVDYYALGITLLHLWFGRDPFEDIDEYSVMRLKSEGRIVFPDDINPEVEKLIKGLITVSPSDRWSYDEVQRWLCGEDVKVNYQTKQFEYKPYSFGIINGEQIVLNNPKELAAYLEKYPEKGEGHLYRNTIAKWIEPVDPGLYNELMDIVENDYPMEKAAGLAKAIYILDTEKPFRVLNNVDLNKQEDIAFYFEQNFDYYKNDLQNPNATFYVFLEARNYKDKAIEYRSYFRKTNPEAALNTLILKLQGSDKFILENYLIYQPEELLKIEDSLKIKIINQLSNFNSKLSLWIAGFPILQPTINRWRSLKRYDATTFPYALQKGFELNGSYANDRIEFQLLISNNLKRFFLDADSVKNQMEAEYWLKNYLSASFQKILIEYLHNNEVKPEEFVPIFKCIIETAFLNSGVVQHSQTEESAVETLRNIIEKQKNDLSRRLDEVENELGSSKINYDHKLVAELTTEKNSIQNQISSLEIKIKTDFPSQDTIKVVPDSAVDVYDAIFSLQGIIKSLTSDNPNLFTTVVNVSVFGIVSNWENESKLKPQMAGFINILRFYLAFVERNFDRIPDYYSKLTLGLDNRIGDNIRNDIHEVTDNKEQFELYNIDLENQILRLEKICGNLPYVNRHKKELSLLAVREENIRKRNETEKREKESALRQLYSNILNTKRHDIESKFQFKWDDDKFAYFTFIFGFFGALIPVPEIITDFKNGHDIIAGILVIIIGIPVLAIVGAGFGWVVWKIANPIARSLAYDKEKSDAIQNVSLDSEERSSYDVSLKEIERYFIDKESYESFQEAIQIFLMDNLLFQESYSKSVISK